MAATTAFTAWPASLVFSSVASATFSINSDWFISDLQLHCYETPRATRSGGKSALELALLGAPRGARKSVFSPVPSTSSSWFQLDHHSRMSVFSEKRKEIVRKP